MKPKAFSVIELVVVVAVIAILGYGITQLLSFSTDSAKSQATKSQIKTRPAKTSRKSRQPWTVRLPW